MKLEEIFGIPEHAAPDAELNTLGLQRAHILDKLDTAFPLIVGLENHSPEQRALVLEYGMGHESLDKFGPPWTVARLRAIFSHWQERSYPDNGDG
jgi:hypothetical protein